MIIGHFEYHAATDRYEGDILSLNFQLEGVVIAPAEREGARQHYIATAPTIHGYVEIGAGWKRVSERGVRYVSVALDAPLFAQPLNAALFLGEAGDHAVLIWNRSKSRTVPALVA